MIVLPFRWAVVLRAWPRLLPALLFVPMVLAPPLNHDVAGVLGFAERWLDGERLYADLLDVNPPLVFVLSLGAAALGRSSGIGGVAALQLCLLAAALGAWLLSVAVRDRAREGAVERALLDVLPGLVAFGAGYDFGQRETLMAMLAVPYLLGAARRMEGGRPRLAVAAALAAAVGFALKPHFLAVPALVEGAVLLAAWRRGEGRAALADRVPWAMAALWVAYLASLPVLFPEYLARVVPLALAFYAEGVGSVGGGRLAVAAALLLAGVAGAWRLGGALPCVLALAGLGALGSAVAQGKGWSYHVMPVELFGLGLAAVLGARWLDRAGARRGAAGLAWGVALYLVAVGEAPWNQLGWARSDAYPLARMLQAHAAGGRVLVLAPGVAPVHPALEYAGARNTLPAMSLWLLEGLYRQCPAGGARYRARGEMGAAEAWLYRRVVEGFVRAPPAAVVVDRLNAIPACGGARFDVAAYFARDAGFAREWARYREVGRQGRFGVFVRGGVGQDAATTRMGD